MSGPEMLASGPKDARATVLLAHGAGVAMDAPIMEAIAGALAATGLRVARFEFAYMAARRTGGPKRPPPPIERLIPEFHMAVDAVEGTGPLILAGKSMGGRIATMIAGGLFAAGRVQGVLCVGYPFHPPNRPETTRTAHLMGLQAPTLICQGTRDPFGTREEVAHYALPDPIRIAWFEDGDHDLKPRARVTASTHDDHLRAMAKTARAWVREVTGA